MPKLHKPRHGSLQFWPRKRAKKVIPRLRSFVLDKENCIGVFPGYKVGMTHLQVQDKKDIRNEAVTIIECPAVKVAGVKFYKGNNSVGIIKKSEDNFDKEYDTIRLILQLQPNLIGLGKKKRIFEAEVGGEKEKKIEYTKGLIGKEINVRDIFKEGQNIDVHAITKGKGFRGTVKRYGVPIRQHKSEKTKRGIGTLGPWTPKRVSFRTPQPGKMGYHLRTEYNKYCMKISDNIKDINVKGGFLHYGMVKKTYLLLKGSISGSMKKVVLLSKPLRGSKEKRFDIKNINLESKQ